MAVNKKGAYGALFVPEVGKGALVKSSKTPSPSSEGVFAEVERLKDELAKRNRDRDDLLYNLNLSNFTPEIRKRLEKLLSGGLDNNTDGGTE